MSKNVSSILVRFASIDDLVDVFNWRNDPLSREMSLNTMEIEFPHHQAWFKNAIEETTSALVIAEISQVKLGVCKFFVPVSGTTCEVSINLNPLFRGKNLSMPFLKKSVALAKNIWGLPFIARIKHQNIASLKLFSRCGFTVINQNSEYQTMWLNS